MEDVLRLNISRMILLDHEDSWLCINEVMKEWMSDGPYKTIYLCTWKGLWELLDNVGLGKDSEDLQEAILSGSSSTCKCFMNTQFSGSISQNTHLVPIYTVLRSK